MASNWQLRCNSNNRLRSHHYHPYLPRFQTVRGCIFCGHKITHESHPPALLRTYYGNVNGQDQDEVHKAMIGNAILNNLVDKDGTWNDKALYDLGDDWQRLLLRVPELCDQERHSSEEGYRESDHEENIEAPPSWRSRGIGAVAVVSQRLLTLRRHVRYHVRHGSN